MLHCVIECFNPTANEADFVSRVRYKRHSKQRTFVMNMISRSLSLATLVLAVGATGAMAQSANDAGAPSRSGIAVPDYPAGYSDPALSPGRLSQGATNVPSDENPNVAGATGMTIVRGDRSTIGGDRRGTIEQKAGSISSSDSPGG
jgi:hypothetical protein